MLAIPWSILPGKHFIPCRQLQSGQIRDAGFHAAPMFVDVGALDLDFNRADPGARGNLDPRIASKLDWIHRVRYHHEASSEVVFGDRIGNAIPSVVERDG